jgi:hypothetical protein
MSNDDALPTTRAGELAVTPDDARWLIDRVWSEGVGIIGAIPKSALCRARHNALYAACRIMPRASGIPEEL